MLQALPVEFLPQDVGTPENPAKPDGRIVIDLVKATELGLTLKQAVAFAQIVKAIKSKAILHLDIDENRWWHLSPEYLMLRDTGGHYAANLWAAQQHFAILERKGLIESIELDYYPVTRQLYRLRTDVVIWEEAANA